MKHSFWLSEELGCCTTPENVFMKLYIVLYNHYKGGVFEHRFVNTTRVYNTESTVYMQRF
jgi:hypothetical protein